MGLRPYFADGMNCFDAAVVAASIADMAVTLAPGASSARPLSPAAFPPFLLFVFLGALRPAHRPCAAVTFP